MIRGFEEEHPEIDVQYEINYEDNVYEDLLSKRIARGELGDIVQLKTPETYAASGLLAAIPEEVAGAVSNVYAYRDQVCGVGAVESTWGILYNRSLFARYGLDEPETYEDFLEICGFLQRRDITPIGVGGADLWHMEFWVNHFFRADVLAQDGDWLKKCAAGEVRWTDEAPARMMAHLGQLFENRYVNGDWITATDTSLSYKMAGEEIAMVYTGPWTAETVQKLNPDMELGWFYVPDENGTVRASDNLDTFWSITAACAEDPEKYEAAVAFLEYFYSRDAYAQFCEDSATFPLTGMEPQYGRILFWATPGVPLPWQTRGYLLTSAMRTRRRSSSGVCWKSSGKRWMGTAPGKKGCGRSSRRGSGAPKGEIMRKQHRSTTFSKMTISFVLFGLLPLLLLSFLFFYRYGSVTRENTLKSCSTMTAYIARSVGDVMENVDSALGSLYDYRSADGQSLAEIYDDADMPYGRKAQEVDAMLHEIMASSGYISSLRMVDAQGNVFSLYYNQDKTLNETGYERTTMEVFGEKEDPTQLKLLGTVPEEEICVNSEDYVFSMARNCMDTSSVETASSVPLATLFADINTDEIGKIIRSTGAAEGKFYVYGSLPQRYIYSDSPGITGTGRTR